MSDKINLKELEAMVSNIVNELGISEVFNEEMNKQIQEKIKSKISGEKEIVQEEQEEIMNTGSDMPDLTKTPVGSQVVLSPEINPTPEIESTSIEPEPALPSFIEKAEPAQVFVFDYNELSLGGENMANRAFRLMSDPDKKKSMHDMWIEEGKIRADVYMVKFEKLGEIKFNPWNTTAKLEEKRFDPELNNIAQPFNENPSEPKIGEESNQIITEPILEPVQDIKQIPVIDSELEAKIYDMVVKLVKGATIHSATGPVGINIPAVSAGQVVAPIMENNLKMLDLIKDQEYSKINTPEGLIESIEGKSKKATLISKNDEVQTWVLEGNTYHLPTNIISSRKCYVSKKTL